jgi:hypothetical protein
VSQGEERTLDRRSPPSAYGGQPCRGDRKGCICATARQPRPEHAVGTARSACGGRPGVPPPSGTGPQAARPDGGRAKGRGAAARRAAVLILMRPIRQGPSIRTTGPVRGPGVRRSVKPSSHRSPFGGSTRIRDLIGTYIRAARYPLLGLRTTEKPVDRIDTRVLCQADDRPTKSLNNPCREE